jgi:hypothetical protein
LIALSENFAAQAVIAMGIALGKVVKARGSILRSRGTNSSTFSPPFGDLICCPLPTAIEEGPLPGIGDASFAI